MNKYIITKLEMNRFDYLLTILDYEINFDSLVREFLCHLNHKGNLKVIIDTALLTGLTEYRFVSFFTDSDGKEYNMRYISPDESIVKIANKNLLQKEEILRNSILMDYQIKEIQVLTSEGICGKMYLEVLINVEQMTGVLYFEK